MPFPVPSLDFHCVVASKLEFSYTSIQINAPPVLNAVVVYYTGMIMNRFPRYTRINKCQLLLWDLLVSIVNLCYSYNSLASLGQCFLVWASAPVAPQISQVWAERTGQTTRPFTHFKMWLENTIAFSPATTTTTTYE